MHYLFGGSPEGPSSPATPPPPLVMQEVAVRQTFAGRTDPGPQAHACNLNSKVKVGVGVAADFKGATRPSCPGRQDAPKMCPGGGGVWWGEGGGACGRPPLPFSLPLARVAPDAGRGLRPGVQQGPRHRLPGVPRSLSPPAACPMGRMGGAPQPSPGFWHRTVPRAAAPGFPLGVGPPTPVQVKGGVASRTRAGLHPVKHMLTPKSKGRLPAPSPG